MRSPQSWAPWQAVDRAAGAARDPEPLVSMAATRGRKQSAIVLELSFVGTESPLCNSPLLTVSGTSAVIVDALVGVEGLDLVVPTIVAVAAD